MKASGKIQILVVSGSALAVLAWKFHLVPKSLYRIIPVSIKSVQENCYYRRQEGSCAVFQCGRDLMRTRFSYLKLVPNRQNKYLIEGTVYFRNKKEICPGLNSQPDTYFEVDDMVEIATSQSSGR